MNEGLFGDSPVLCSGETQLKYFVNVSRNLWNAHAPSTLMNHI